MAANMEKVADKQHLLVSAGANLRYERKFVFANCNALDIIQHVYRFPFGFKEVFYQRKVNNIYFDDSNYNFYKQNVEGVANRKKLRLRWYGNETSIVKAPSIEIKIKKGEVGDKITHKFKAHSYNLDQQAPADIHESLLVATADQKALHQGLSILHPTLLNTYERRYFLSFCSKFRITIDFNQEFYNPNYRAHKKSRIELSDVILELKYAIDDDNEARELTQYIGSRLSKNSKYVNGINLLYHPQL